MVVLIDVDSKPIPAEVDLATIWVINGTEIWESGFGTEPRPPRPDYELERVAWNGPTWGPGITVDVVVSVTFGTGVLRLIGAREQMINRLD
jgi:hypothetical protein